MKKLFKNTVLCLTVLCVPLTACQAEEEQVSAVSQEPLKSLPFLVVDLDGDGIELIPLEESNVYFDVDGDGLAERTQWVHPDDGFIFLMTYSEAKNPKSYTQRLIGNFINGVEKIKRYDMDHNGILNQDDFKRTSEHIAADLGINFLKDNKTDGFSAKNKGNEVRCVNFNFISFDDMTVSCGSDAYNFAIVQFDYEDSNVLWPALCKVLRSPHNYQKSIHEYRQYCTDSAQSNK